MESRYVSLFWRLLVPNVTVLTVACVVLILEPANGRVPALAGGLAVMITVHAVLIRRAMTPLTRLTRLMGRIDPVRPGERLPVPRPPSEITLLTQAFNDMLDRLEAERRESGMRALNEREGERRRVAAELHDQIGQTLTALGLQADRIATLAPEPLADEVRDLRDGVLATVEDVRNLARDLRPEALDTLGLVPALTNLSERMTRRTGIDIQRHLQRDLPALDPDTELVIYRIAQESLTNAVRHGRPTTIELTLRAHDDGLHLGICDDGIGISTETLRESGIRGMRERALSIGADLRVEPRAAGNGTQVMLEVPLWRA
jgi:two-component system, NarL family, sensor histidine kinase UhpB